MSNIVEGLQDVAITETKICFIDGGKGRLIYSGYDIGDLAEHTTFEETAHLLWKGALPTRDELDALQEQLITERTVDAAAYDVVRAFPKSTQPMDALRTLVSFVATFDPEMNDHSPEANFRKAIRLTAKIPTLIAAFYRSQRDLDPIAPLQEGGIAHNFLYMLSGEEPDAFVAKTLDTALILHAEHGMNASTFSARVTCATLSDMYAATVSAIGTLKGPLHGGANAIVLAMLREIDEADKAGEYVRKVLDHEHTVPGMAPGRVPGFGHRVYKAMDPRATVLRGMSRTLAERAGVMKWVEISEAVQKAVEAAGLFDRGIYPNVDFFSASSYYTMGIDEALFTPVFAMARIAGWTAHIMEQHAHNRLIRPRAIYVGPKDLKVVPIDER